MLDRADARARLLLISPAMDFAARHYFDVVAQRSLVFIDAPGPALRHEVGSPSMAATRDIMLLPAILLPRRITEAAARPTDTPDAELRPLGDGKVATRRRRPGRMHMPRMR